MTMFFDRNRAMLLASSDGLDALADWVAADGATPPDPQWFDAGILRPAGAGEADTPELEPMVAGIVELVTRPARSVVLERFADGNGEVTFVNWDTRGRVAVIEGAGEGLVSIVATDLKLLPGRMIHAVGLRPGAPASDRPALTTTAAAIEAVLGGTAATASEADTGPDAGGLAAVLGSFERAWRASGAWSGQRTDDSITVLSAGSEGLWLVDRGPADAPPSPATPVRLVPISPAEASRRLGDVVSGRGAGRAPRPPGGEASDHRPGPGSARAAGQRLRQGSRMAAESVSSGAGGRTWTRPAQ